MSYLVLQDIKLRTSKGEIVLIPGQAVKLPEMVSKTLLSQRRIQEVQDTKDTPLYGCEDGPGVCHKGTFKYCDGTRELEWYCQPKNTWCWKAEIGK